MTENADRWRSHPPPSFLPSFPLSLFALLRPALHQRSPCTAATERTDTCSSSAHQPQTRLQDAHCQALTFSTATLPVSDRGAERFQCSVMKLNPFNLLPTPAPPRPLLLRLHSLSSHVIKKKKYDAQSRGRTSVWKTQLTTFSSGFID